MSQEKANGLIPESSVDETSPFQSPPVPDEAEPAETDDLPRALEQPSAADLSEEAIAELKQSWGRDRDVSLEELDGLPIFEQFYRIWGTPARGRVLWEAWLKAQNETTRALLHSMAEDAALESGVTLEEAQTRMAVEKFVSDQGLSMAGKYVDQYKARRLRNSRSLRPMLPKKRKK